MIAKAVRRASVARSDAPSGRGGGQTCERMWKVRGARVAAGVTAVGLALSGCGGEDATIAVAAGKGGGADLFAAMAEAQAEVGSYRMEVVMEAEGRQTTAEGAVEVGEDFSDITMTMTMQVPVDAAGTTEELTMLVVDGRFYMQMPASMGMPTDKPWLTIDPAGSDPVSQMFGSMVDEMAASAELHESFAENAELIEVEEIGGSTVDGVDVTEYRMTVDAQDLDALGALPDSGLSASELGVDSMTYALYVDDDNLLRRMTTDLGGVGSMQMRLFDFGAPVEVEAPPADQVTDFGSMMEGLMDLSEEELEDLLDR